MAATTIVERLIAMAPTAIGRSMPQGTRSPPRRGWRPGCSRSPRRGSGPSCGRSPATARSRRRRRAGRSGRARCRPTRRRRRCRRRWRCRRRPCARAGASFTPSPTMATLRPPSWKRVTAAALSAGRTCAATSSMPSRRATESATAWLSPVIIATRMPRRVERVDGLGRLGPDLVLDAPRRRRRAPSTTTWRTVRPCCSQVAAACGLRREAEFGEEPRSADERRHGRRPGARTRDRAGPRSPMPAVSSTPRCLAPSTIARASGCSESASTAAASAEHAFDVHRARGRRRRATGSPLVSVPVLSKMTMSSVRARSSASRSLTSRPFRAPSEVEMAMTSGIASPSA